MIEEPQTDKSKIIEVTPENIHQFQSPKFNELSSLMNIDDVENPINSSILATAYRDHQIKPEEMINLVLRLLKKYEDKDR